MPRQPRVSVIILHCGCLANTQHCIRSLLGDGYEDKEIIIFDNGSPLTEGEHLRAEFGDDIIYLRSECNIGFAAGNNRATAAARGQYIVLLNADTEVTPGWMTPLISELNNNESVGVVQPKIRSLGMRSHFDYAGACGGYLDCFGYPFTRGRVFETVEKDKGQYDEPADIHWASGACLVTRRNLYRDLGGLDERFFAYMEEIDFCCRVRATGGRVRCIPVAVIYHRGGITWGRKHFTKRFHEHRNNLLLLMKNLAPSQYASVLLPRLALETVSVPYYLLKLQLRKALAATCAFFSSLLLAPWYVCLARTKNALTLLPVSIVWRSFVLRKRTYKDIVAGADARGSRYSLFPFIVIIGLGLLPFAWAMFIRTGNFFADESVGALVAAHVLDGEFPVYFWGQRYMGSGYMFLSAPFLALIGRGSIVAWRLPSFLLIAMLFVAFARLVMELFDRRTALFATFLLALPVVATLRWFTIIAKLSLGIVFLLFVFGNLRFLRERHSLRWALAGVTAGFGIWTDQTFTVFLLVTGVLLVLLSPEWKALYGTIRTRLDALSHIVYPVLLTCLFTITFLLFYSMYEKGGESATFAKRTIEVIAFAAACGLMLASRRRFFLLQNATIFVISFLIGRTPEVVQYVQSGSWPRAKLFFQIPKQETWQLMMTEIFPHLWGIDMLITRTPPLGFTLFALIAACLLLFPVLRHRDLTAFFSLKPLQTSQVGSALFLLLFLLPLTALLLKGIAGHAHVRYVQLAHIAMMPMIAVSLLALWHRSRLIGIAVVLVIVIPLTISNGHHAILSWRPERGLFPPQHVTELHQRLNSYGVKGGYADYWTSYPLNFFTSEHLIFTPYTRKNRYIPYRNAVESMSRLAYIVRRHKVPIPNDSYNVDALLAAVSAQPQLSTHAESTLQNAEVVDRFMVGRWDVWILERLPDTL